MLPALGWHSGSCEVAYALKLKPLSYSAQRAPLSRGAASRWNARQPGAARALLHPLCCLEPPNMYHTFFTHGVCRGGTRQAVPTRYYGPRFFRRPNHAQNALLCRRGPATDLLSNLGPEPQPMSTGRESHAVAFVFHMRPSSALNTRGRQYRCGTCLYILIVIIVILLVYATR